MEQACAQDGACQDGGRERLPLDALGTFYPEISRISNGPIFGNDVEESISAQSEDFVVVPQWGFSLLCVFCGTADVLRCCLRTAVGKVVCVGAYLSERAGGFLFSYDLPSPSCDVSLSWCRRALEGGQAWGRQYAVFLRNFDYLAGKNVWASLCFSLKWG